MTKMKTKIIIATLLTLLYYAFLLLCKFTVFDTFKLRPAQYQISENCLIVDGQVTTGPSIVVIKGSEYLAKAVPSPHPDDLNVGELEMTGKTIYSSFLKYPDYYASEWLVYGEVVGTTDMYTICGSGTIPVFECKELYPIMSLPQFFTLETVMFSRFPFRLLGFIVYFMPFFVMGIYATIRKTRKRSHSN